MRIETVEAGTPEFEDWVSRRYLPWCEAFVNGLGAGREDPVYMTPEDRLAMLRTPVASERRFVLAALDGDDRIVGAGRADLPMADNLSLCWVAFAVLPEARQRGHGTALLHALRDLALENGRTSLLTELERPVADGASAHAWPGSSFAARHGLTMRLESVRRDLRLPVDAERIARLRWQAQPHAAGYRIECFRGPVRVEDREAMAGLKARMSTDAPMGDLEYEPEVWDASRVAEQEDELASMGATWWTAVAVAADGRWAGFTQLFWSPNDPKRLHQEGTLVLREHRGRRLGLLMKLAALELATGDAPSARVVITGNAASNTHMIAINEAMGFLPAEITEEWQADVSQLA